MLYKALRLLRVFHDKKQSELAQDLQISKAYLSEIEAGIKTPSVEILERYSKVLKIPLSSILFFAENIESRPNLEKARGVIASKVLAILEFIADKAEVEESNDDQAETV